MKYIIYARKSTESEDRQIQSIDDQINYLNRLAKDRDLDVVEVFSESKSAKAPGRLVFEKMLKFIESGKADGLLVWKLDRIARNPLDAGRVQWMLQSETIKEIVTSDGTHRPEDNAIVFALLTGMANQYSRDLSTNVKRGIKSKLEKGIWPNYAPIGYKNRNEKITIDKKKAHFVERAFVLYAVGNISLKDLASQLYEEGFRSRGGNKYHKSKLNEILRNTFYYGVMHMHGEYYLGKHEPLINKELFDRVQVVMSGKGKAKRQTHDFVYRGFLKCEECGCALTATTKKGYVYYYCTNGKGNCDQHKKYLREEKIEKLLASTFDRLEFNEDFVHFMYLADKEDLDKAQSYKQNALDALLDELKLVTTKQKNLLEVLCSGTVKKDAYTEKEREYSKQEIDLKAQIAKMQKIMDVEASTLEQQKNIFLTASRAKKEFLASDQIKKKEKLEILLWNATIKNEKIAQLSFDHAYNMIAKTENKNDFSVLRRGRDSNPRAGLTQLTH